jgi:hypothetical protein
MVKGSVPGATVAALIGHGGMAKLTVCLIIGTVMVQLAPHKGLTHARLNGQTHGPQLTGTATHTLQGSQRLRTKSP